jgi:hypothetical protein
MVAYYITKRGATGAIWAVRSGEGKCIPFQIVCRIGGHEECYSSAVRILRKV